MPNVSLTPELERFADACVQSGRYDSVSDVARAAFRLLQEVEEHRVALLKSLQDADAEAERDGCLTVEEVSADLHAAIDQVARRQP
jgi:antitoxin ParD1/3/4